MSAKTSNKYLREAMKASPENLTWIRRMANRRILEAETLEELQDLLERRDAYDVAILTRLNRIDNLDIYSTILVYSEALTCLAEEKDGLENGVGLRTQKEVESDVEKYKQHLALVAEEMVIRCNKKDMGDYRTYWMERLKTNASVYQSQLDNGFLNGKKHSKDMHKYIIKEAKTLYNAIAPVSVSENEIMC